MHSMAPARREPSCRRRREAGEISSDLRGRPEAVTLARPLLVASPLELPQGRDQFREGGQGADQALESVPKEKCLMADDLWLIGQGRSPTDSWEFSSFASHQSSAISHQPLRRQEEDPGQTPRNLRHTHGFGLRSRSPGGAPIPADRSSATLR